MARTRSRDYKDKKNHILNVAAAKFAELGYLGCKMEDVAQNFHVSKSMLRHYFKRKQDVLGEILREHVSTVNNAIESYLATTECKDRVEFFVGFIERYLELSITAHAHHAVTVNEMRWLTPEQKVVQRRLERRNLNLIVQLLERVNPAVGTQERSVYALLLIGMINSVELWSPRGLGPMSRAELYERISILFLKGFLEEPAKSKKRTP